MEPMIESTLYKVSRTEDLLVSLADMKQHLEVDYTDRDDMITWLIEAVTEALESELRRSLVDQTWDLKLSAFPWGSHHWHHRYRSHRDPWNGAIVLPMPPLVSVESVTYYDENNALQTFDAASYEVTGAGDRRGLGRIRLATGVSWPAVYDRAEPVIVRFRAGYLTSDSPPVEDVPKDIKHLVKLMVADQFANRETIVIGETPVELKVSEWIQRRYRVYD